MSNETDGTNGVTGASGTLGERLEALRKARDWTQREVAEQADVSERTYQLWRSGRTEPYGKHRRKLAEIFDVPVSTLSNEPPETAGILDRIEQKTDVLLERMEELEKAQRTLEQRLEQKLLDKLLERMSAGLKAGKS